MNHKAIYKLYPQVVTVDDTAGAFDKDGNKVEIDMALVNAWQDPEEYILKRQREYPPITDYIDSLTIAADDFYSQLTVDGTEIIFSWVTKIKYLFVMRMPN